MKLTAYIHATKESMRELGEKNGLKGQALDFFSYACCEVNVTLDVDELSGRAVIVEIDGRSVSE